MNINELKSYHDGLAALKPGDMAFCVTRNFYDGEIIRLAKVVGVTKTRIKTTVGGKEKVFTKDGYEYPKNRGNTSNLYLMTPENTESYRYNISLRRAQIRLRRLFEISKTHLNKLTEMELRNLGDVLEKYTAQVAVVNLTEVEE